MSPSPTPLTGLFDAFAGPARAQTPLRSAITARTRIPEPEAVAAILDAARVPATLAARRDALAMRLASRLRDRKAGSGRAGLVQNLLQEYALSSQEGVALMCLAEALLRIPDRATRDALIRDKIAAGQWQAHLGHSPSLFVNATTWGLLLTGKLVATHSETGLSGTIGRVLSVGGEPLIRKSVDLAMRMMGEQFVTGETIHEALDNSREFEKQGFRYSYDMLGEAALTAPDAARYLRAYEAAIDAIGKVAAKRGIYDGPGISIKLSALHPRYSRAQSDRVNAELYPALLDLCVLAKHADIGLNVDAEEAERLEISLDLLEQLAFEPALKGWNGLGFVLQAYQKRCPAVVDYVIDLARRSRRRLMIRLVKGAYWDSEIKRAQVDGQDDYPVFTRKRHTDASYIACARKLLAAPEAVYPQFATHNAHTLATIYELADPARYTPGQYEFQCLHGMGEPLYEQVVGDTGQGKLGRPCRIYGPVGTHQSLLAYLVRRLLENGANTSFVNRVADRSVALENLIRDPVEQIDAAAREEGAAGLPHPAIALPRALYGDARANSRGLDLSNEQVLRSLATALQASTRASWQAPPLLAQPIVDETAAAQPVTNPANRDDLVGDWRESTAADIESALHAAQAGARAWADTPVAQRADRLEAAADQFEARMPELVGLLIREAGKTAANGVSEVRETVDFLRYYAHQARQGFDADTHRPLGPVACISPWNFPLSIFMGQVCAALAAGNVVLAKPAEQTPLIAAEAVRMLWTAGVPRSAVQLLPGRGDVVGARLVADPRVQGVVFTGSTEVARLLQRAIIGRVDCQDHAIPLIAETGGQNAMIVDTSALTEQVVTDVLVSAFDSAGQRCSALRVLCIQEESADHTRDMLLGAMAQLRVGGPELLSTDVGPVIDPAAKRELDRHIAAMRAKGRRVHQIPGHHPPDHSTGSFVTPTLIELDSIDELRREHFGPVLHLVRYRRDELDRLIGQINATGYGLTMGLHTRIDETIDTVVRKAQAGNLYVNRNMVGAVVGVQPFGGEGLSGTGPKAGGPLYLYRLLATRPDDVLARVLTHPSADTPLDTSADRSAAALLALRRWAEVRSDDALVLACDRMARCAPSAHTALLPGPTGERNVYRIVPRCGVLCLARDDADRLVQLAAVLAIGSRAVWPGEAQALGRELPRSVQQRIRLVNDWTCEQTSFDALLLHGTVEELVEAQRLLSERKGRVSGIERLAPGETGIALERLVVERALSINTAAAGGNASLMTIE